MSCNPPPRCYQGVVPALIATAALDGTPNVTYLSQVFYVDERHVALSCQFFNKTKQNVMQTRRATVVLYDPLTFEAYRLALRYQHAEETGPLFDAMSMRIEAIASHTGMSGVFRLKSADVYEVEACEHLVGFIDVPAVPALDDPGGRSELRALQVVSQSACRAESPEQLFEEVLLKLDDALGFQHAMFLLPEPGDESLRVVAQRGYPDVVVGTVIGLGEGFIGIVAKERRVLRVSGIEQGLSYGRAVRGQLAQTSARRGLGHEIPLLGLPDAQSALVMPLVVGERLVGLLAVESRHRFGFDEWDETFLEIVANQVATSLQTLLARAGGEDRSEQPTPRAPTHAVPDAAPTATAGAAVRRFRFFPSDDCVFVDGEYLIRNVPGRILWKLLREHADSGRTEYSNRELRLDPWLGLPSVRDNLESRLTLLRKRLAQKCPELSLPSTARGHFRLEATCAIELEEPPATPRQLG